MHQSGSGKDPSLLHTQSSSEGHPGLTSPPVSSSCNLFNSSSSENKVPRYSDNTSIKNKIAFEDDPDVIELSNKESFMYNNRAENIINNETENQFSILASSSSLNNNQVSNDNSATKVPNTINTTIDTSSTKVPIAAFAASSTSSILSNTLLSASNKSSSSLNNSMNSISPSNNSHTHIQQNNNNLMFNSVSSGSSVFNVNENNEPMKFHNHKMTNNSAENFLPTKSSSDR